jgi:uncharacterized membrane protein required for colicin V production
MSDQLVLDILFGLIVVLFAAIGFWRGAAKEAVVTAGILVGAELARSWGAPWGNDLHNLVDLRVTVAKLLVAVTALLSATLVLGYGGSVVVGAAPAGLAGRFGGALLSAINGGLLLHYVFRFIQIYLEDPAAQRVLDKSDISRLLLHEFGLLLVGAAVLAAVCVLGGLAFGRRLGREDFPPLSSGYGGQSYRESGARQRPVRLPRGADDGKVEPVQRGFDPAGSSYAADAPMAAATMPLAPVEPSRFAQDVNGGWDRNAQSSDEWYRRAQADARPAEIPNSDGPPSPNGQSLSHERHVFKPPSADDAHQDEDANLGSIGQSAITSPIQHQWTPPVSQSEVAATSPRRLGARGQRPRRCRRCFAELGEADSYCPTCGSAVR